MHYLNPVVSHLLITLNRSKERSFPYNENEALTITMARHGYIAAAPIGPEQAISVKTLDCYAAVSNRCGNVWYSTFRPRVGRRSEGELSRYTELSF